MAILRILHYPHPLLKEKSRPIETIDASVRKLVADMAETMYAAPGVGLAAPQVGHPLRLAIVDITRADQPKNLIVLINPQIISAEGECVWDEGCLSIPGCNEEVRRKKKVVVRYTDLDGKPMEMAGEDLLAIALQHEIDHLDGILFIDRLSKLKRDFIKKQIQKEMQMGNRE